MVVGTVLLAQGGGVGGGVSLLQAPISYGENGAFPLPTSNPSAGMIPVQYRGNGQFPEPLPPNPAAGVRPVDYRGNGQVHTVSASTLLLRAWTWLLARPCSTRLTQPHPHLRSSPSLSRPTPLPAWRPCSTTTTGSSPSRCRPTLLQDLARCTTTRTARRAPPRVAPPSLP